MQQCCAPPGKDCTKYDLMMSVECFSDWALIMIGPGGLLFVVSHLFPVSVLWVRLQKIKELNLDVKNILFTVTY